MPPILPNIPPEVATGLAIISNVVHNEVEKRRIAKNVKDLT